MVRKGFVLLALIFALIASASAFLYLNGLNKKNALELRALVVAKSDIAARSVLIAEQLTLKEVPVKGYPQGGVSSVQGLVGSVPLVNLKPGDPILSSMVEHSNTGGGQAKNTSTGGSTALTVPEGKRAVAVPIGLVSGVGYAVKPGDHVDVLVTLDLKDPDGTRTITSLAAQDILVLSVGESISGDKSKPDAKSYTLALSVPQAMAVTLGSEKGSLRLLLRNPANSEQLTDSPIDQSVFLSPDYHNIYK